MILISGQEIIAVITNKTISLIKEEVYLNLQSEEGLNPFTLENGFNFAFGLSEIELPPEVGKYFLHLR